MEIIRTSEKRFQWLGPILAVVVVGTLGLFAYWLMDRTPPIKAMTGQFVGWDRETPRLGYVVWRAIPQRSDCEGTIYRYIVNGEIVTLTPRKWEYRGPLDNPNDDPITWTAPFNIPDHINHDASYRNRIEFVCNPLHKFWPIPLNPPDVAFALREESRTQRYVRPSPKGPIMPDKEIVPGKTGN